MKAGVRSGNRYTYNKERNVGASGASAGFSGASSAGSSFKALLTFKFLRLLFIPLAALLLYSGLTMMTASAEPESVRPATAAESTMTVDSGDTLWSIAQDVKPDGMKTGAAVHLIMKRNGLTSSSLASGQSLILPAKLSPSHNGEN